jgi:hypothetical protein
MSWTVQKGYNKIPTYLRDVWPADQVVICPICHKPLHLQRARVKAGVVVCRPCASNLPPPACYSCLALFLQSYNIPVPLPGGTVVLWQPLAPRPVLWAKVPTDGQAWRLGKRNKPTNNQTKT